jgi:hypothetical protein
LSQPAQIRARAGLCVIDFGAVRGVFNNNAQRNLAISQLQQYL